MRVLQLIDSLQAGGAERVAVNIANALVFVVEDSYLCATREEGLLKKSIDSRVNYLFLNKNKTIDFKAIKTLNRFVRQNKIELIHAHSTSFFLASILRILNKNIKIIWHDHYGNSAFLKKRAYKTLKICSRYFSKIYSVNIELQEWAIKNLNCNAVGYLSNFTVESRTEATTVLKGKANKRIIHLANLRAQKDHYTLLVAFAEVVKQFPDWTLHCVGKDFEDAYSKTIKDAIEDLKLEAHVFIYGSKPDVSNILSQADLAVLSSKSEGLPIALLEYGLAGLPTIVTHVGNCNFVITEEKYGQLIAPENPLVLSRALLNYINNMEKAKAIGSNLKTQVETNFSAMAVTKVLIADYKYILK